MFMYSKKNDLASLRVFLGIDKDNQPKLMFFDEGVYDFNNEEQRKQYLRIFLGVNEKNETTLIMKNEQSNSVVISPSGMFSCYQISDRDSFDTNNPFKSHFYIPSTLDNAFSAKLIVTLQPFRAYSKTAKSAKENVQTTEDGDIACNTTETRSFEAVSTESGVDKISTTETRSFEAVSTGGSGTVNISMNVTLSGLTGGAGNTYVGGTGSVNSTTGEAFSSGGRTTGAPNGSINSDSGNIDLNTHTHWVKLTHSHGISVDCGQHKHPITVSGSASGSGSADDHKHKFTVPTHSHEIKLPGHKHKFTVPTHDHGINLPSHKHEIVLEGHTHEAVYGIYEETSIPNCSIYINGVKFKDINGNNTGNDITYEFDITSNFKALQSGVNILEFRTSGLARASFTMFWGGYYDYE